MKKKPLTAAQKGEAFNRDIDNTPPAVMEALYQDSMRACANFRQMVEEHKKGVRAAAKELGLCIKI